MSKSMKGGNIIVKGIEAPVMVTEGEIFTAKLVIKNGANVIAGSDPDCCGDLCNDLAPASPLNGYKYEAEIESEWDGVRKKAEDCIGTTEAGKMTNKIEAEFTAPSLDNVNRGGASTITGTVKMKGSGEEVTIMAPITIQPEAPGYTPPQDDGDDEDDSEHDNKWWEDGDNDESFENDSDKDSGEDSGASKMKSIAIIGAGAIAGGAFILKNRGDD